MGHHEVEFVCAAHNKKLPVCIVKLFAIRQFASACYQLAKTHKIDAMIIAEFAYLIKQDNYKKVALTAAMRKLIIIINGMITTNSACNNA